MKSAVGIFYGEVEDSGRVFQWTIIVQLALFWLTIRRHFPICNLIFDSGVALGVEFDRRVSSRIAFDDGLTLCQGTFLHGDTKGK